MPSLPYHSEDKKRSLDKMSTQGFVLLFSHPVVSHSLWPQGLQHARLPHSPLSPGVCSNSCPLSRWCHPTISSSVVPFSSCPQFFPALQCFSMSRLFASGGHSIGALALVLPMNIQDRFPLGLLSKGLSRVISNTSLKASILQCSAYFMVQLSHQYMTTGPICYFFFN